MLRAVLFDLDNTLVDRDRAFRDCLCNRIPNLEIRNELARLDRGGYGDRTDLFAAWRRHGGIDMDQELFGAMLAVHIQPDGDLLRALKTLSRSVKLGIISNGGSSTQRRKWNAAGLQRVIPASRMWVSEEVGLAKPDRRIFSLASQMLEEEPCDCLYLGDNYENDVEGAVAAGMRGRLVQAVLTAEQLFKFIKEEQDA